MDNNAFINEKYEYMLHTWGGFYNDEYIKIHNHLPGYFWFTSDEDRNKYIKSIKDDADKLNISLYPELFCYEGRNTRYKTIANMNLKYLHETYKISYDFGFGYPEDQAIFMFTEGNYSCDCNLSLIINEQHNNVIQELDCGNEIKIENLKIDFVRIGDNIQFIGENNG